MDARVRRHPLRHTLRLGFHSTTIRPSHWYRCIRDRRRYDNLFIVEGGRFRYSPMRDKTNPTNLRLEHHSGPHPYNRVDGNQGYQGQEFELIAVTEMLLPLRNLRCQGCFSRQSRTPPPTIHRKRRLVWQVWPAKEIRVGGWAGDAHDVAIGAWLGKGDGRCDLWTL